MARGKLFVMAGASGVGKGTIRGRLLERHTMHYSVSMTTRPPRAGEQHGTDYYFVSKEEFSATVAQQGFFEHAQYVDDFYGTPKAPVMEALEGGKNVLLEIDMLGAFQVAEQAPDAVMLFVIPPSLTELRRRLLLRGTDTLEKISKRLERAQEEIKQAHRFDYIVVNDQLEQAVNDFSAIITAESLHYASMQAAVERALHKDAVAELELDAIAAGRSV